MPDVQKPGDDDELDVRFHESNMLQDFSTHILQKMEESGGLAMMRESVTHFPNPFIYAEGCSGSCVFSMALETFLATMSDKLMLPLKAMCAFTAEIKSDKQQWARAVHGDVHCCFKDVCALGGNEADCVTHNKKCPVPSCHAFVSGFSCTAVSSYNSQASSRKGKFGAIGEDDDIDDGSNATLSTWKGCQRYIAKHLPEILLLENVTSLDSEPDDDDEDGKKTMSNLQSLLRELEKIGYICGAQALTSSDFGVAQKRKRIWIWGLRQESPLMEPCAFDLAEDMNALIESFKQESRPLDYFLLRDDDPILDRTLEDLMLLAVKRKEYEAEQTAAKMKSEAWPLEHSIEFSKLGFRYGVVRGSSELESNPWYKALTKREQDIALLAFLLKRPCADVSTSIKFLRSGGNDICMATITPGMKLFTFRLMRLIVPVEAMALQGIPWHTLPFLKQFSDSTLFSLAGNAFTSTVAIAVMAALLNKSVWKRNDEVDAQYQREMTAAGAFITLASLGPG
jgi:site-specific DNA-cytosine methylase